MADAMVVVLRYILGILGVLAAALAILIAILGVCYWHDSRAVNYDQLKQESRRSRR